MKEGHPIRILFLADSHLGFDLPARPRVQRRRRGHDFLANHLRALEPAQGGGVDLVVHGGDLFHRPRVPPSLVFQAFQPLRAMADAGVPVFVVPGNHERSRIPHERFASHPNIHVFREPATFRFRIRDTRVALSGFPYHRKGIREGFPGILKETGWDREGADLRLLCVHHCVEGARVGPKDFTFREAPDVIRTSDLPGEFAAVLSGHIHRHQVLGKDLRGRPLKTPVYYPGSLERTAFAEAGEEKGYLRLEGAPDRKGGRILRHDFVQLPSRPMEVIHLAPEGSPEDSWAPDQLGLRLRETLAHAPGDAVLQIRVQGHVSVSERAGLSAAALRRTLPGEMNVQILFEEERTHRAPLQASGGLPGRGEKRAPLAPVQHRLAL